LSGIKSRFVVLSCFPTSPDIRDIKQSDIDKWNTNAGSTGSTGTTIEPNVIIINDNSLGVVSLNLP